MAPTEADQTCLNSNEKCDGYGECAEQVLSTSVRHQFRFRFI